MPRQFRLWLALNRPLLAVIVLLLAAGGVGFALVGGMSWLLEGQGPSERVEGVVRNFGMAERDEGSYRVAVIETGDGRVTARAPIGRDCQIGDRAILSHKPVRFGGVYALRSCHAPDQKAPATPPG